MSDEMRMAQPHSIRDYYAGTTVLVTGGSGFLGKAIIEKLLRTCKDVKMVYVMLRSKIGVSSEDRLEKLKNSEIFNRIRSDESSSMKKLHCITGDISEDQLGLSEADAELLQNTVNIIIHSAATVRFNDPIKIALNTNVLGTKRILELSRKMTHLKGIVHISTAYSNPSQRFVEEKVYESSQKLDLEWYITCANTLEPDAVLKIMHHIHGHFPNTYTMTKFMAEQLVEDYRRQFKLPVVIVRPSIIGSALEEPYPGWVDTLNGVIGACIEIGRGTIGSVFANKDAIMDVVPLDIAFNMILVSAWFDTLKPSKEIRVLNCTSGDRNGINWDTGNRLILKHSRTYPSKYTMFYPSTPLWMNPMVHSLLETFHTFLPAFIADQVLRLIGEKPMMYKIQQKFRAAVMAERFFATRDWNFAFDNVQQMLDAAAKAEDASEFTFDICKMNWNEYVERMVLGTQKYILKSGEESLPRSRQILKLLYAARCIYYGCILGLLLWIVFWIVV